MSIKLKNAPKILGLDISTKHFCSYLYVWKKTHTYTG